MKSLTILLTGAALAGATVVSTAQLHAASVGLELFAEGFTAPTNLSQLPDGRFLVSDQLGTVHLVSKNGEVRRELFLDLRDRLTGLNQGFDERGLLGLALHPQFADNKRFFVYYSAPKNAATPADWDHRSRLSEFRVDDSGNKADPGSEKILMEFDQPYFNHNGGDLAFGPDGLLYIAVGDGGRANDTGKRYNEELGNGQNTETLLGKILRIDVDSTSNGKPYGVPSDNPFVNGGGLPEIYAYGLRNPWRMSFDRGGSRGLIAADVGQTLYEEVNVIEKGGNYGWFIKEGPIDFNPDNAREPKETDTEQGFKGEPLIAPVAYYKNANGFMRDEEAYGISITGGFIYRGKAVPSLEGKYVFADWTHNVARRSGIMLVADAGTRNQWTVRPLELEGFEGGLIGPLVTSFGQDNDGELYVLTNDTAGLGGPVGQTGKVWKLVKR